MKKYIGVKQIKAKPMTRGEYNSLRGWDMPKDESPDDEGYLVEYLDGGPANVEGSDNYISWSPADVFLRAYRPVDGMTFGLAIEALKMGKKVARAGWNGKGMWLVLVGGTTGAIMREGSAYKLAGINECDILPHIDMWTTNAQGRRAMLPGWLASQTDMLSTDWLIVE